MESPVTDRLVYSIPEAAYAVHCSKSLMYDLVAAGRIKSVHLSEKRRVILKSELLSFLQAQSQERAKCTP